MRPASGAKELPGAFRFRPGGTGGFTLLELTAALLVTSLVLLAAASSIAAVASAWERGESRADARQDRWVIGQRLGWELARLDLGPFGAAADFIGERTGFSFIAGGKNGPREVAVTLETDRIVLREKYLRLPGDEAAVTLAEGIDSFQIDYYDAGSGLWSTTWPSGGTSPPALVRLTYTSKGRSSAGELVLPVEAGRIHTEDDF